MYLTDKRRIITMSDVIHQSDIMYEDSLVCILRPDVKKGVIVFTNYVQPRDTESLRLLGLKTGKKMHEEGIQFGRTVIHPYIFFRAPWFSRDIDYSTYETEINSSFGQGQADSNHRCFIRVDPDKTIVFSSEIRTICKPNAIDKEILGSQKTLSDYLKIIAQNAELYKSIRPMCVTKKQPAYNLYTSELIPIPNDGISYRELYYPMVNTPIERNSEILVSIPHLTPEYFVLCT